MQLRSVGLTVAWAVGTFAVILAAGWPLPLNAVDLSNGPTKNPPKPVLIANGIELSVDGCWSATRPSDMGVSPDDPWTLSISAENRSGYDADAKYTLRVMTASTPPPQSRVLTAFTELFKADSEIALKDGQTAAQKFQVPPIPSDKQVNILLISGKQNVLAGAIRKTPTGLGAGGKSLTP
jgi:hypothetical protein